MGIYRYYITGLKIENIDYTAKLTIGVDENGNKFYDHALTQIEKTKLIDYLNQSALGFISTEAEPNPSVTEYKDTKLLSILQTNITKTLDINAEPKKEDIAEYITINKPEIMNTKEEQKMESALEKPLANEYGQKYKTFDVIGERMFEGINFFEGNTKIYNDGDVASIFKLLEIKTRENLFAVLLNDNNNPIILHLSNGNLHSTVGYTTPILAAITKLENIKTVTLIHNHPSGNLNPSPQDAALLKCLANDIQIISPNTTLTDGIIINTLSGQYSVFNTNGDFSQKEIPLCTKEIKHTVYEFDQIVFNANYRFDKDFQIKSSDDIAKYISAHRLSEKDKFGYLLLDYNHHIVGNIVPMIDSISAQNKEEVVRDILKNTVLFGGSRVILYGRGLENQKQIMKDIFQSLKERWNEGIIALDIISFPSNRINKQKADTTVSNKKYLSFLDECIVSELSSQYKTPSMEKQIPICPISKVNDTYLNQAQQKDFNNFQPIILEHFIFNDNTIGAAKIQLNKDFSITVKKTSKKSMAIGGQALTTTQEKALYNKIIEFDYPSIKGDIIIAWNYEKYINYAHNFEGLNYGEHYGLIESDLYTGNKDSTFKTNLSILIKSDELEGLSPTEKFDKIIDELNSTNWKWNNFKTPNFEKKVEELLGINIEIEREIKGIQDLCKEKMPEQINQDILFDFVKNEDYPLLSYLPKEFLTKDIIIAAVLANHENYRSNNIPTDLKIETYLTVIKNCPESINKLPSLNIGLNIIPRDNVLQLAVTGKTIVSNLELSKEKTDFHLFFKNGKIIVKIPPQKQIQEQKKSRKI